MRGLFIALLLVLTTVSAKEDKDSLTLGFMPYLSASVLMEKYTPLADYLSEKLGKKVKIVIAENYAEHIKNTGEDKLDISFLGGSPYVVIADKYGKKPLLARYEFDGKPTFHSVIFVSKDSNITSLSELQNKRFAFGNKNSTLSSQVPLYMLMEANVTLGSLSKYSHLRNHENVIYGVMYGDYDAGSVAEEIYDGKKSTVKAIAFSPPLSTHVFVTSSKMDKALQKKIKKALLALKDDPQNQKVLQAISADLTGFVDVNDSDYDLHRKILKVVLPVLEEQ